MADEQKLSAGDAREEIQKVALISYDESAPPNARDAEQRKVSSQFNDSGAIEPPYSLDQLGLLGMQSNVLRQCIDTMKTNCDQFGYRLVPIIDLTADDADEKISNAIYLERLYEAAQSGNDNVEPPTEQEVKQRREVIEREMPKEYAALSGFFAYCTDEYSFIELRERTRIDLESIGDGYWEITRNGLGDICALTHVVGATIRKRAKGEAIQVPVRIRISPISFTDVKKWRRFRTYVQICEGMKIYFKEFGDRRVLSAKTGVFYTSGKDDKENVAKMVAEEGPDARAATELWNISLYSAAGGAYGLPRWFGNILSVEGSHKAEYVNFLYFDNKAVPPLVVMVEGGSLAPQAIDALKDLIENKLRKAQNFHKALVLEAKPAEGSTGTTADGKVRIKIQPLTDAILKEGMFMAYDAKNRDKISESFRLPKLLRGDSSDINRATAEAALAFAEQQVFSGERNTFDFRIDRTILTDMQARYYEFESLGPDLKNPEALAVAVKNLEGAITVNEARAVASDILGRPYKATEDWWGNLPVALALAMLKGGETLAQPVGQQDGKSAEKVTELAKKLVEVRTALIQAELAKSAGEFKTEKQAAEDEEPIVVPLEAGALDGLIERS